MSERDLMQLELVRPTRLSENQVYMRAATDLQELHHVGQ